MSYHTATELAQIGNHKDKQTGAVSTPIHLSTTFAKKHRLRLHTHEKSDTRNFGRGTGKIRRRQSGNCD